MATSNRTLAKLNVFAPRVKILKNAKKIANEVEKLKDQYRNMSDAELKEMTNVLINEINVNKKTLDDILVDALAVVREAAYRVHKLFAYHVQLIGAAVVCWGDFAEMYTGEGKTLVIILANYVLSLFKKGVHVVTVNEYLVKRDAEYCAEVFKFLGLTVGYNLADMDANAKRAAYACDVTYTTNSELGFDYLRDNMVRRYEEKVIRDLNVAIIDEGDSILIDEARTPLIIAGQPKKDVSEYITVDRFVKKLVKDDYVIDPESNSINLTETGIKKAQDHFKVKNLFDLEYSDLLHKIKNALMANFVFVNGKEYIVRNDEILLVDHFTGRVLEGRSYNAGLHQAIQAKESVKIEPENITVATITYQSFFRLYAKIAGVSGTAMPESEEFLKTYNMVVVPIPTNKPVIRKDYNDYIFSNKISKWSHVVSEIERVHKTGQPILVGTASVEDSEELCHYLRNHGLPFELLNAKNHAREAEIVARAGQKGAITISTNMAGRGTDIKLGEGVKELGGLYVIGTERHESRRIDRQLQGRSGRQGDPGMTRFFISLQDTLFTRFATDKQDKANDEIDHDYFNNVFFTKLVNRTQKKVENINYDVRKNLIDYDSVLSNQRELVYKQRDQILKNVNNNSILANMAKGVAEDIVHLFVDKHNPNIVDSSALVDNLNNKLFGYDLLPENLFKKMTIANAKKLLMKIINTSVLARLGAMNQNNANAVVRDILIQNLDTAWTTHLDKMIKLREGVSLRSLEQRSPLNIYVSDGDKLFKKMRQNVAHQVIIVFHKLYIPGIQEITYKALVKEGILKKGRKMDFNKTNTSPLGTANASDNNKQVNVINLSFGSDGTINVAKQPDAKVNNTINPMKVNPLAKPTSSPAPVTPAKVTPITPVQPEPQKVVEPKPTISNEPKTTSGALGGLSIKQLFDMAQKQQEKLLQARKEQSSTPAKPKKETPKTKTTKAKATPKKIAKKK